MPPGKFMQIEYAGEKWTLLPQRALFSDRDRALIVADIHFGKAAAFRAAGVPVPSGATAKDLDRLTALIRQAEVKRLIILGDFFHAKSGRSDAILASIGRWRESHKSVSMLLVRGNHDRSAGRVLDHWNIEEADGQVEDGNIIYSHAPIQQHGKAVLAGHVHPVFTLQDYDGSSVRVPCFVFDQQTAILPSFGTFTGGHRMTHRPQRRLFAVLADRVIQIAQTPK